MSIRIINHRRACAERVTVVVLCVCLCMYVCHAHAILAVRGIKSVTKDTVVLRYQVGLLGSPRGSTRKRDRSIPHIA